MDSTKKPTTAEAREAIDDCIKAFGDQTASTTVCETMHGYLRARLPNVKAIDVCLRPGAGETRLLITIDIEPGASVGTNVKAKT